MWSMLHSELLLVVAVQFLVGDLARKQVELEARLHPRLAEEKVTELFKKGAAALAQAFDKRFTNIEQVLAERL